MSKLDKDHSVLDLGAGGGNRHKGSLNFRGKCKFVAGVDPGEEVLSNEFLDEARQQEAPDFLIPYETATFDLVFSNSVIEHIVNETLLFSEVERVLKPGGVAIFKTPNMYHYVPTIARLTPHWFHDLFNRMRGRDSEDTFPTTYACNSRKALTNAFAKAGLEVERIEVIEGRPEYLRMSFPTYLCGITYERIVNSTELLRDFRCVLYATAKKPDVAS